MRRGRWFIVDMARSRRRLSRDGDSGRAGRCPRTPEEPARGLPVPRRCVRLAEDPHRTGGRAGPDVREGVQRVAVVLDRVGLVPAAPSHGAEGQGHQHHGHHHRHDDPDHLPNSTRRQAAASLGARATGAARPIRSRRRQAPRSRRAAVWGGAVGPAPPPWPGPGARPWPAPVRVPARRTRASPRRRTAPATRRCRSWRLRPGLADEDQLVHPGRLVAAHQLADLRRACRWRRAGPPAPRPGAGPPGAGPPGPAMSRSNPKAAAVLLELLPDDRAPGVVVAEGVVVGQRVPEEVRAVEPAVDGRRPRRGGT